MGKGKENVEHMMMVAGWGQILSLGKRSMLLGMQTRILTAVTIIPCSPQDILSQIITLGIILTRNSGTCRTWWIMACMGQQRKGQEGFPD